MSCLVAAIVSHCFIIVLTSSWNLFIIKSSILDSAQISTISNVFDWIVCIILSLVCCQGCVNAIWRGCLTLLSRQSKTVALWELDCQGQAIRFVFDSQCRGLLTALPPHDSADYLASHLTAHRATTLPPHEK